MPTDLPPDYKPAPPPKPGEGQPAGHVPAPPGEDVKGQDPAGADPTGSGPKIPGQKEGDIGSLPEPGEGPGNDLPGMPAPAGKPAF